MLLGLKESQRVLGGIRHLLHVYWVGSLGRRCLGGIRGRIVALREAIQFVDNCRQNTFKGVRGKGVRKGCL